MVVSQYDLPDVILRSSVFVVFKYGVRIYFSITRLLQYVAGAPEQYLGLSAVQ